ncbi:hypothetical protein SLS53_009021 [Cytospora paraplurivora]|uniref:Major facilitator superfamily (MFS) profile domain-containing protein n=1 Tax=Cytospora paraplurivora TaxID=2898453 RepID=A0AAN9U4P0_9PEZI
MRSNCPKCKVKLTWPPIKGWFSGALKIRLVLAAVGFELVGGGFGVVTTMVHVIAADVSSGQARTRLFLAIHAIGTMAAILGQITSSLLMPLNLWLPWITGLSFIILAISSSMIIRDKPQLASKPDSGIVDSERAPLIESPDFAAPQPELHADIRGSLEADQIDATVWPEGSTLKSSVVKACGRLKGGFKNITAHSRLIFLLTLVLICQMSEDALPTMLLLYVSKRFGWSFARANYLWALGEGVQLAILLVLLPGIGRILNLKIGWDAYSADSTMARSSTALLGLGTLLMGVAGQVPFLVVGIVLASSGAGLQSLLRSLITDSISPTDVSVVYSVVTILHVLGGSLAGPLYSTTFSAGLRLGTGWTGLPFIIAGGLGLVSFALLLLLRRPAASANNSSS